MMWVWVTSIKLYTNAKCSPDTTNACVNRNSWMWIKWAFNKANQCTIVWARLWSIDTTLCKPTSNGTISSFSLSNTRSWVMALHFMRLTCNFSCKLGYRVLWRIEHAPILLDWSCLQSPGWRNLFGYLSLQQGLLERILSWYRLASSLVFWSLQTDQNGHQRR